MDEHNYFVVSVDVSGKLITKATFLNNTKITSSKMGKDKDREKNRINTQGNCISHIEMLHVMLKYPEVVTDIDFIKVSTVPLELRSGIVINSDTETKDGAYVVGLAESFHRLINLDDFRLHT